MKNFPNPLKFMESLALVAYTSRMRLFLFIVSLFGYSLSHADCISDALTQANVDRSASQVTTTPVPSDGSGEIKYQISVFGPQAGGAVVVCTADNTFVRFEAPFQFIGSN